MKNKLQMKNLTIHLLVLPNLIRDVSSPSELHETNYSIVRLPVLISLSSCKQEAIMMLRNATVDFARK